MSDQDIREFKIMNTIAFRGFKRGLQRRYDELRVFFKVREIPFDQMMEDEFVENYRHITKDIYKRYVSYLPEYYDHKKLTSEREQLIRMEVGKIIYDNNKDV